MNQSGVLLGASSSLGESSQSNFMWLREGRLRRNLFCILKAKKLGLMQKTVGTEGRAVVLHMAKPSSNPQHQKWTFEPT